MIEFVNISQIYGSNIVILNNINVNVQSGEVLAVIGHNGSGKSSLLKIMAGQSIPAKGQMFIGNQPFRFQSVFQAQKMGFELLEQKPAIFPDLSIIDNIFAGIEDTSSFMGLKFLNRKKMQENAEALIRHMDLHFGDLNRPITDLSGGQIAIVGFLRSLQRHPKLLALDEPTAALGPKERNEVNKIIKKIAGQGVAVVLVTHLLKDVINLADKVAILKEGRLVFFNEVRGLNENSLLDYMDFDYAPST